MRGADERINDERIPRIPRRRCRRSSQPQEQPGGEQVGGGVEELVRERAGAERGERTQDQLGGGRVNGGVIAMVDACPSSVPQMSQRRRVGRAEVGIDAVQLDASFPQVTREIVARERRQQQHSKNDGENPEDAQHACGRQRARGSENPEAANRDPRTKPGEHASDDELPADSKRSQRAVSAQLGEAEALARQRDDR